MSKSQITPSILFALMITACTWRQEEEMLKYSQIVATYTGKTQRNSASLQEVFTSPNTSHYEWVYDSITIDPDTIRVVQVSTDSFELQVGNGFFISPEWKRFGFKESSGPSVLTYGRSSALANYFSRTLTIEFDLSTKSLLIESEASQNTPASNSNTSFNGIAQ